MAIAISLLGVGWSSAFAQQTLQLKVDGCSQLNRGRFTELLVLELGSTQVAAQMDITCMADEVHVAAHSLDGTRNASRVVQNVLAETDPERVLALAASELFEIRWDRIVVKDEVAEEPATAKKTRWNIGPEIGGRIQRDVLLLHLSLQLEHHWSDAFSFGVLALGNYGSAGREGGDVHALWLSAGVTSSYRMLQLDSLSIWLTARITAGWAHLAGDSKSTDVRADTLDTWALDGGVGLVLRTNTGAGPFDILLSGGYLFPEVRGGVSNDSDVRLSGPYVLASASFRPAF